MIPSFFSMALVTLNNEISLIMYKSAYSFMRTNCDAICELVGPYYKCNFEDFWDMSEDKRKEWMYDASENKTIFDTSALAVATNTTFPAFDAIRQTFVGYKKSADQNLVLDCSSRPSKVEMNRFCPCVKKYPFRTFFVGRANTDCTQSCKCHNKGCSTTYLSRRPREERINIVNATAHLYRKKYNVSNRAIEIHNDTSMLSQQEIMFWDDFVILGLDVDLSGSDCNAKPTSMLEKRFCECYNVPKSYYEDPDPQICGTGPNAAMFQPWNLCLITLMSAVWFW